MAKKATLTPVTDTALNAGAINTQLNAINDQLDNTLSLDGSVPNAMGADLDMNSNDLLNVKDLSMTGELSIDGVGLNNAFANAAASEAAAAVSATSASLSATQAAQYDGIWLDDVATLLADTTLTYTVGQPSTVVVGDYVRTRKEGFAYQVATVGDVTTAGGIQLDVMAGDGGYNVKAFGAVGDDATDDTLAIQKAINKVSSGGTVYIPNGIYQTTSTLQITQVHVKIYGDDQYNSILKGAVNSDYPIITVGTNAGGETWGQYGNVTFSNLLIDGNRTTGLATGTSAGILTTWAAHIRLEMCRITRTRGYGVHFYTVGYSSVLECNITDHSITGVFLDGIDASDSATSTLIEGNQISSCRVNGIHAKNFFNITVVANVLEDHGAGGTGAAIKLEGGSLRNFVAKYNYFEANSGAAHDIDFSGVGIQGLSIQDNWLAGTPNLTTYNAGGATVINGVIQDNEGGDPVGSLADVVGIRSIELLGRTKTQTGGQQLTSTTGTHINADTASITLDGAGTWIVNAELLTEDAGGLALTEAFMYITSAAGQSAIQNQTNVNFKTGADATNNTTSSQRLSAMITLTVTTPTTLYLASTVKISAGTLAYKGSMTAVRVA